MVCELLPYGGSEAREQKASLEPHGTSLSALCHMRREDRHRRHAHARASAPYRALRCRLRHQRGSKHWAWVPPRWPPNNTTCFRWLQGFPAQLRRGARRERAEVGGERNPAVRAAQRGVRGAGFRSIPSGTLRSTRVRARRAARPPQPSGWRRSAAHRTPGKAARDKQAHSVGGLQRRERRVWVDGAYQGAPAAQLRGVPAVRRPGCRRAQELRLPTRMVEADGTPPAPRAARRAAESLQC